MKDSKNIAIGLGVVALGACGYLAYSTFSKELTPLSEGGSGSNKLKPSVLTEDISHAMQSVETPVKWQQGPKELYQSKQFDSVPLYQVEDEIVNVLESDSVYAGIPNEWFVRNKLEISEVGVLQGDPDGDEFDNLSEFQNQTNPRDTTSFPDIILKLEVVEIVEARWLLEVSSDDRSGGYKFKYTSEKFPRGERSAEYIKVGDYIFPELFEERFKFSKVSEEDDERYSYKVEVFEIEDSLTNSTFKLPRRIKRNEQEGYFRKDQTATVVLNLDAYAGQQEQVSAGSSFSLPFDSAAYDYTLTSVEDNGAGYDLVFTKGDRTYTKKFNF